MNEDVIINLHCYILAQIYVFYFLSLFGCSISLPYYVLIMLVFYVSLSVVVNCKVHLIQIKTFNFSPRRNALKFYDLKPFLELSHF